MNTPPAGWHPDPEGSQQLRYWDGQQWTSATQPMPAAYTPTPETPEQAKNRKRQLLAIAIVIVGLFVIVGISKLDLGKDDENTAAAETTTAEVATSTPRAPVTTRSTVAAPAPPSATPMYVVTTDSPGRPEYMTAIVAKMPTQSELENILAEIRIDYLQKDGGYHVAFDCSSEMEPTAASRIANGKFAVGRIGAARTGLSVGGSEVEMLTNPKCAGPVPDVPADAVSADDVLLAIRNAGLPVIDPRVNTTFCLESGCVKLITTDEFSIYQFADTEKANKFSTIFPSYHQNGLIFLRYTQDGSDPTDPALIPQYNAVLDQVMGG
jgi:hypothetical protein